MIALHVGSSLAVADVLALGRLPPALGRPSLALLGSNRRDVAASRLSFLAELGPRLHQLPALVQQVATGVSLHRFIAHAMRQAHLDNVNRVASPLAGPIAEGRAESMGSGNAPALRVEVAGCFLAGLFLGLEPVGMHAPDDLPHAVDADLFALVAGEHQLAGFSGQRPEEG